MKKPLCLDEPQYLVLVNSAYILTKASLKEEVRVKESRCMASKLRALNVRENDSLPEMSVKFQVLLSQRARIFKIFINVCFVIIGIFSIGAGLYANMLAIYEKLNEPSA